MMYLRYQFKDFAMRKEKMSGTNVEPFFIIEEEGSLLYKKDDTTFMVHLNASQLFNSVAVLHFQGNHELR